MPNMSSPSATVPSPVIVSDGVDFCSSVFPEHAFPPPDGVLDDYRRLCRRGYAVMARSRVAITGLARNIGQVLPVSIRRVEDLGRLFADYRVVVFENDSVDDTKLLLRHWSATNRRVTVICEDLSDPVNPATRCLARAERMADYRRRSQDQVLDTCRRYDATILVDLDILGGWSLDGIAHTFGHTGWDFVGSNGLVFRRQGLAMNVPRQYDTWALRFDRDLAPVPTVDGAGFVPGRGEPLVPVTSCFGGLGIYTMEAYAAGRYEADDIEHATFHRRLIAEGHHRLFLNPSQIVIYGRRHRRSDGIAQLLIGEWASLTGRRPPRALFGRSDSPTDVVAAANRAAA